MYKTQEEEEMEEKEEEHMSQGIIKNIEMVRIHGTDIGTVL